MLMISVISKREESIHFTSQIHLFLCLLTLSGRLRVVHSACDKTHLETSFSQNHSVSSAGHSDTALET